MPRTIQISISSEKADLILQRIPQIEGICGLGRVRGASINPPGDVLTIDTTNDAARRVFAVLDELEVMEVASVRTSEPRCLLSRPCRRRLESESNETVWEEMASLLRADTNLQHNYLILMTLAGAVAGVGLWTDRLHIVIGAMLIAPAFEPLVRLAFGAVSLSGDMSRRGLVSSALGYALMAIGGAVSLLLLRATSATPRVLAEGHWVQYWSTINVAGAYSSLLGALAGAVVIAGLRSVLTTGVMITLALVPSMSLVGMALVDGSLSLVGGAALRWGIDVVLVLVASLVVLALKRRFIHRNPQR